MTLMQKLDKMVEEAIQDCPEGGDMSVGIARVTALKQMRKVVREHEESQ